MTSRNSASDGNPATPTDAPFDYSAFQTELTSHIEDSYRDFAAAGTPTQYPFLGVRLPVLRELSAKIVKNHAYADFLSRAAQSFEEITIQGIVIASLPYEEMITYFDDFVKRIDNWGTCDTFCNTLKSVRRHREGFLPRIDQLLTGSEFEVRVALVILLSHYIDWDTCWLSSRASPAIFARIDQVKHREEYYIKMAIAWLLAECFIKHPDETWEYLATANLPKWTNNKAISKIRDSFRVDQSMKDAILTLRK